MFKNVILNKKEKGIDNELLTRTSSDRIVDPKEKRFFVNDQIKMLIKWCKMLENMIIRYVPAPIVSDYSGVEVNRLVTEYRANLLLIQGVLDIRTGSGISADTKLAHIDCFGFESKYNVSIAQCINVGAGQYKSEDAYVECNLPNGSGPVTFTLRTNLPASRRYYVPFNVVIPVSSGMVR